MGGLARCIGGSLMIAIETAQDFLKDNFAQWILDNCVIIDTETTGLGENDGAFLFLELEILSLHQPLGHTVGDVVLVGRFLRRAGDDQRRSALHEFSQEQRRNSEAESLPPFR